ncbi:MAG: cytochrome c biogenesis CcdA family protein [Nitrososphaeria archaeon]
MAELQVLAAFLGGLASFFSPCVYPLIPVVISYSCGAGSSLRTAFYSSFLYVLGLAVTMVMAGVVVTFLAGTFLSAAYVSIISSIIMIVFGSMLLIPGFWYRFGLGRYVNVPKNRVVGPLGAFAIGLTFGFSWIPCVTPIYLSILSLAAVEGSVLHAAILMLFYAFGVGLPLVALGVVAVYAKVSLGKRSRRAMLYIEKIAGGVLVLLGVNNILPFFALPKFIPL